MMLPNAFEKVTIVLTTDLFCFLTRWGIHAKGAPLQRLMSGLGPMSAIDRDGWLRWQVASAHNTGPSIAMALFQSRRVIGHWATASAVTSCDWARYAS